MVRLSRERTGIGVGCDYRAESGLDQRKAYADTSRLRSRADRRARRGLRAGHRAGRSVPNAERHVRAAGRHLARRVEAARGVSAGAHPRVGWLAPPAGEDRAKPCGVRGDFAQRLHGLEGVFREPARVLRDREPLSPGGQRSVSSDPFSARALGLRALRELGSRVGAGPRDQPRAAGIRRLHLRHDRLQRQPAACRTRSAARARACGA